MNQQTSIEDFIKKIPKAELHLHIEGTFEPELMFEIAKRNKIEIKYKSIEELKNAYNFNNLQEFLDIYYEGAGVLIEEQDFYDMTWAYLQKAHSQNVIHAEIFFDPQTHTDRGIKFETVINGIHRAVTDAKEEFGMSAQLIMCFLRHLDEESAIKTFKEALPYKDKITAVGLDSSEVGNPPSKFQKVFEMARGEGFLTVAHAGEEGPAEYVWEALNLLKVSRIDHGNHCLDDEKLIAELAQLQMPLTVCPLSNLKLKVVEDLTEHPLKEMMQKGLLVTINSDDPAYFGGYINENYLAITKALNLSKEDIVQLAKNSFKATFLEDSAKKEMIKKVEECIYETVM
ncbi:adenosine deaminase [Patescibacteria group bacterium]|nr:adenosine deaminase [Patescibacteria group bacterium]MBU1682485.1 adenosine deaminase [Patescibacteria group bacterium]MBU1934699.1 adenosine deaminase [Patescibacteria group bacterium]